MTGINDNTLVVTANKYGTIFVEMNGNLIADSATWNRKRGFSNKMTGEWVSAPKFTAKKIKQSPEMVVEYLAKTGTLTVASVFLAL
jgi:hypothetical protein|tara:strand:- start:993 stop:1250 length:258 start_codon:yes stop_codon:yes gene_type:complete